MINKYGFRIVFLSLVMAFLFCLCVYPKQLYADTDEPFLYYITPLHFVDVLKPSEQSYRLYRIGKDGQNQQQLSQGMVLKYQVAGDWIYYFSVSYLNHSETDLQTGDIYRMKKDGTEVQRIDLGQTAQGSPMKAIDFTVVDDWVYYIDSAHRTHRIWRVSTDGTQNSLVSEDSAGALAMLDGRLYLMYLYKGKDRGLYSMDLNGGNVKAECPESVDLLRRIEYIMSRGGWLGYQSWRYENKVSEDIYVLYNPSTGSKINVPGIKYVVQDNSTKRASSFYYPQLLGEYNGVYLLINQNNKQNVVVCQPGNNEPETVVSEDCTMAQLDGSTLYYITASDNKLHSLSLAQSAIQVFHNGNQLELDNPPVIQNGRLLVPIRPIAEAMGAQLSWEPATRTVGLTLGDTSVSLIIGGSIAYVNGQQKQLDVPAQVIKGNTFVPLRFVSEALGATVKWDGDAKIVYIAVD
jgi:hypothetical protein